jgi:ribonucleoside-diphosphate reductase beta chain
VSDGIQLNDPQILYRRWEESQWSPFTIDLSADQAQWAEMEGEAKQLILFVLSSLMVAEERITTKFSGLVGAYGSEEEATFLATQQVDEARHMQFYARFRDEVIAQPELIAALVEAHERLVREPASASAKVRFVTLYHLIVESTLGLTSFKFTTDYLVRDELLPGFVEGYSKIHYDETRHIGYGIWFLRESVGADPALGNTVRETLRELPPSVAESLAPAETGSAVDFDALVASSEDIRDFALSGLRRRLDLIGVPLETL